MKHVRAVKICSSGARDFWKRHNLDWSDFLSNGISSDKLEATGDAQAFMVVEVARGEGR